MKTRLEYELLDNGQVRVIDRARGREGIFDADGAPRSGDIDYCGSDLYHMVQWAVAHAKVLRAIEAGTQAHEEPATA